MITVIRDSFTPFRGLHAKAGVTFRAFPSTTFVSHRLAEFVHGQDETRDEEGRDEEPMKDRDENRDKGEGEHHAQGAKCVPGTVFLVPFHLREGGLSGWKIAVVAGLNAEPDFRS